MAMMEDETGHESHAAIFLNAALTFVGFSLSGFINQQLTKYSRLLSVFPQRMDERGHAAEGQLRETYRN